MLCKTIILSNSENLTNNAPKGILTLSKENNIVSGKIRLYNLHSLPASAKVGIYVNEKVHISTLSYKQQCYTFILDSNIDINQSVYCALIDTADNKKVLLEGGSFNGFYFTDSPFDAVLESKDEQLEQTIDTALKQVEINENCNCNNCANCEYKKHFYDNYMRDNNQTDHQPHNIEPVRPSNDCEQIFNSPIPSKIPDTAFDDNVQSDIVDKLKADIVNDFEEYCNQFEKGFSNITKNEFSNNSVGVNEVLPNLNDSQSLNNIQKDEVGLESKQNQQLEFLNDIVYQLDELLTQNPADELLNSIIPNSRFVKVENENPYVLGVIYENKMLKYIAYGVPASYNQLPPKDFGQHYQWLPLNPRDVMSDGYFMIFQDALTGNLVEINFEE